jgi:hypothetical protein
MGFADILDESQKQAKTVGIKPQRIENEIDEL